MLANDPASSCSLPALPQPAESPEEEEAAAPSHQQGGALIKKVELTTCGGSQGACACVRSLMSRPPEASALPPALHLRLRPWAFFTLFTRRSLNLRVFRVHVSCDTAARLS